MFETTMANLIRSAKSGNEWTVYELLTYNFTVVDEDVATFFGNSNLPPPTVDPIILNNVNKPPGQLSKSNQLFLHYLEDAMRGIPGQPTEVTVDDFGLYLLGLLDYDEPNHVIHQ